MLRVQYFTNLGLQELAANNSFLMGIYQANMGYMFMGKMLGLVGSKDVRLEDHTNNRVTMVIVFVPSGSGCGTPSK